MYGREIRDQKYEEGIVTAQAPNRIFIHGRFRDLLSSPAREFLDQLNPKPAFCARSTANWCGYTTSWEIREEKLYLTDLEGTVCRRIAEEDADTLSSSWCKVGHLGPCDPEDVSLASLCDVPFGGIFAEWFSGQLRIPEGELVTYVHAGWASGFERDLIVEVEEGCIRSETITRIAPNLPPRPKGLWKRLLEIFKPHY